MAKHVGDRLNEDLLDKLGQGKLYRDGGLSLSILMNGPGGWPHVSTAPGAVAARPDVVWTAIGGKTGSAGYVRQDPRVTLLIAGPDTLYMVKGEAEVFDQPLSSLPGELPVKVTISEVIQDMPPYVTITSGVTYSYGKLATEAKAIMNALLDDLQRLAEEKN